MKIRSFAGMILAIGLLANCSNRGAMDDPDDTPPDQDDKNQITVMSYNVHHCNPVDNPTLIDVETIAGIIKNSGAELVGLQEIDVNNTRSGVNLDQAAKLGELTGMHFYFSKAKDYAGGAYGTALLSKYPISNQQTILLPKESGTEQRTLSLVTVTLPEGQKIHFANTHLDHTSEVNALAQAKYIQEQLKELKEPIFMTGDFNAEPASEPIKFLMQHYDNSCGSVCPDTYPAPTPTKAIDFIFYSKPEKMTVRKHTVLNEPRASDHRPVVAKLSW